jgi:ElaB/YqjD/DUF883 family membrane-anchored ribosome-binding protein
MSDPHEVLAELDKVKADLRSLLQMIGTIDAEPTAQQREHIQNEISDAQHLMSEVQQRIDAAHSTRH